MLGAHYSYAKVPLGFWMQDWFGWTRNNYDKIGHFMQGFGPAIYTREFYHGPPRCGAASGWVSCPLPFPLAFSAVYEIIEWLASLSDPTDTEAFLGTQVISGHPERHVLVSDRFDGCAHSAYEMA